MTDNVVGLDRKTVEYAPQETIVEILEDWLAMAKAGHITSVLVAGVHIDSDGMNRAWWGKSQGHKLLGIVDIAHSDLRECLRGKA